MAALSSADYPVDPMDVAIRRARQPLSPPFWGTLAFANSAEVGTSFFDARRFVFWSIFATTAFVATILLTDADAGALFQITAPPLPVLALTIFAGFAAGSSFGFGKMLASLLASRETDQRRQAGNPS